MRRVLAVPVVVVCALGLGGCRGGDQVAPPVATPAVAPSAAGSAADPLAGIESEVDAVERDLNADADAGPAPLR